MGYKPPKTVYGLDFGQTEYAGLEVAMRSTTLDGLIRLQKLSDENPTGEEAEVMFRQFAALLVSWNVEEEDDTPVPATYEGVVSQEPAFILMIINAYGESITQAPPPLPGASSSGGTSPEAPPGLAAASTALRS